MSVLLLLYCVPWWWWWWWCFCRHRRCCLLLLARAYCCDVMAAGGVNCGGICGCCETFYSGLYTEEEGSMKSWKKKYYECSMHARPHIKIMTEGFHTADGWKCGGNVRVRIAVLQISMTCGDWWILWIYNAKLFGLCDLMNVYRSCVLNYWNFSHYNCCSLSVEVELSVHFWSLVEVGKIYCGETRKRLVLHLLACSATWCR